ncbi:hypothetical protein DC3_25020 [Deinococcus cellulosilyticus NBRC 106333 = KACC 11606]|uniref:Uncharacterized protein n=2 Tax=Deinococcus cellulosilyticus TaxID=401558 RepID=A0A511N2Y6_DEIC1|nr:hypothetical protein DC3_25020 [Deinococcus cellulosilyticus NBRC 106333 = KACC 11606]
MDEFQIHCPVDEAQTDLPFPADELFPLLEHLKNNQSFSAQFPRGTVTADGRLDLCKQNLGVEGCRQVMQALKHNSSIHTLLLGTDGIGDAGAQMVAEVVAQNSTLHTLYLGCNHITDAGTALIAEALMQHDRIEALWLKRNPIGPQGAESLARLLEKTRTLKVLDLVNAMGDPSGIAKIISVLTHKNRTVRRLYLGGNNLTAHEAGLLAEMLQKNPTIEALMLNVGRLQDEGAAFLAEALRHNTTLRELGLASNGIGARGGRLLFRALRHHPTLQVLDLGYAPSTRVLGTSANTLTDQVTEDLALLLEHNPVLKHLNLARTGLTLRSLPALQEALQKNHTLQELQLEKALLLPLRPFLERNALQTSPGGLPEEVLRIRSVYRSKVL